MRLISKVLAPSGFIPNSELPVLHYKQAFDPNTLNLREEVESTFKSNGWVRSWVNGIFDYHHYHSNNHEVLGITAGHCTVMLGGENGALFVVERGDVLVLPAGTGHKRIEATPGFSCVGAYSINVPYNMRYGEEKEFDEAITKIKALPLPKTDPVYGGDGPLLTWRNY